MFTFFCTTCEAKLIAKDEKLIGKIVPCPKCGSMVFAQPSDDEPTPLVAPKKSVVPKRFPDVLTFETASGMIGHTEGEHLRAEVFLETGSTATVSDIEIKTRRVLMGILFGLAILLFIAIGFLVVLPEPDRSQPPGPPPEPIHQVPIELQPIEPEPLKPAEGIDEEPPVVEVPPEAPPLEPVSIQNEQFRITNNSISVFEERLPGFVDISVPNIDIDAKLALPIGEMNFNQSSLIEFIRVMSRLTEIPMTLDIDEMKPRSFSVQTPVSGRFSETTAGIILTETLATLGLQWVATDRQILIFPKVTPDEVDLTFDVSDFTEKTDDLTPEVLSEMVRRLVVPEANITVSPESRLTVVPNENNRKSPTQQRDSILRFLEQLRVVRQLPQKTEWTGETLAPEAFGWDQVMKPMTLNHYRPVPLSRIISQLESATGLTVIVDHQSLHRALCSFASIQATVQCDRGTVNDALELSLAAVDMAGLAYRIVDHRTLEITTTGRAQQPDKMVMEVHRYKLREGETAEDVIRSWRSTMFPDSWSDGDIVFDLPSGCLFVRQSQPAQRQLRLFLSTPGVPE